MKYFRWPPDFINTMTWTNFMLFMAAIPRYSNDEDRKDDIIRGKDSDEIFG